MKCPRCNGKGKIDDNKTIGARWRAQRERKGVSQRDLADAMGISPQYLCDLEKGARQWLPKLEALYCDSLIKL